MLSALSDVILPVILVAGLGMLLSRRFSFDQSTLNKVQLYALVPALSFSSLLKTTVPAAGVVGLGGAFLLTSLAIGLLAWLASLRLPRGTRGSVVACAVVGNNGNFGLPIALLALGPEGLDQAVVIFLFSTVLMWTVGPVLLGSHGGVREAVTAVVRMPVLWAMLAAVLLRAWGLAIPVGVNSAIDLIAAACVPMVLLGLGIQLGQSGRIHVTAQVLTGTVLRVLVLPLVALGIGRLVGLNGLPLQSLVLACAMPTAVNISIQSLEFGSNAESVASTVALGTLISVGTISFVVSNLPLFA